MKITFNTPHTKKTTLKHSKRIERLQHMSNKHMSNEQHMSNMKNKMVEKTLKKYNQESFKIEEISDS